MRLFSRRVLALVVAALSLGVLLTLASIQPLQSPPRQKRPNRARASQRDAATARSPAKVAALPFAALAKAISGGGVAALAAAIAPGQDLLVTFGSMALAPFLSSLLSTLVRLNVTSLVVGALDAELHDACIAAHVPVLRIDGGAAASSGYFRKNYGAFKKMGARKARFLATLLAAVGAGGGGGLWVCDADVSFLRPPSTELAMRPSLAAADVLLSTDCIDLAADRRGACTEANLNTGVLYLRSTEAALAFTSEWARRMETVGPEPWLDDQAVLNNMVREGFKRESAGAVAGAPSRTYIGVNGKVRIGLLPLDDVANGHTFFVQHPCAMCQHADHDAAATCACSRHSPPLPFVVHTTFQFGDTAQVHALIASCMPPDCMHRVPPACHLIPIASDWH